MAKESVNILKDKIDIVDLLCTLQIYTPHFYVI